MSARPKEQTDDLKRYCRSLGYFEEGALVYYLLEGLRLPEGCQPAECDALLCPVERDGYPSRLFFSEKVTCVYTRNWNVSDARIGERNWHAFSWKITLPGTATLVELLLAHLGGFAKEK